MRTDDPTPENEAQAAIEEAARIIRAERLREAGRKGGLAARTKLTPTQRSERAARGGKGRWKTSPEERASAWFAAMNARMLKRDPSAYVAACRARGLTERDAAALADWFASLGRALGRALGREARTARPPQPRPTARPRPIGSPR